MNAFRGKRADYTFDGGSVCQKWRHSPMPNLFCIEEDPRVLRWLAERFVEAADALEREAGE